MCSYSEDPSYRQKEEGLADMSEKQQTGLAKLHKTRQQANSRNWSNRMAFQTCCLQFSKLTALILINCR
jgi:hypothetical protein